MLSMKCANFESNSCEKLHVCLSSLYGLQRSKILICGRWNWLSIGKKVMELCDAISVLEQGFAIFECYLSSQAPSLTSELER